MALNSTIRARIEKPTSEDLGVTGAASTLPNTFGNNWNDPAFRQSHHKRQVLRAEQTGALASSYSRITVKPPTDKPNVTCNSAAKLLEAIETTREAVVRGLHSPPAPKSLADELAGTFNVDDKALRYFAFTTEKIRESASETVRTRKVSITFFVSDETMLIQEKRVTNSGLSGGTVLKRQRVPIHRDDAERRDPPSTTEHITLNDILVGSSINILGRRYLVYACDGFTREFLIAIGADVQPDGPEPDDSYLTDFRVNRVDYRAKGKTFETKDLSATHESLMSKGKCAQHYPEEALRAQRFVRDSGKVLCFNGLWNDEDAQPGGLLRTLELRYFVEDDTISMVERTNPFTQKEVVQKTFLSRRRVPVSGKAAKHVELTFANRVNGQREHFLGSSDRYYDMSDLAIGAEINVFGRKVQLYSCDAYTREFLENAGIRVGDDIDVSDRFPKPKARPVIVPPPTGYGTHEDSLASCSIALKPPKKDLRGFHEHGSNSLRFEMRLHNPESPEDNLRKFLLTYYLADGEIQITELAIRNTGFTGGRFMKKQKVEKTKGQRDFIGTAELQVGAVVNIAGFNFLITNLDQHSEQYLTYEETKGRHPDDITRVTPERLQQLVAKFREFVQVRFYTNTEAFRAFDRDHDGFVSLHEMVEALKSNLITDREEEAAALVNLFDKSNTSQVSYKDFMEAVAIHKEPEIPTETMQVESEPYKAKGENATRAAKRKVVLRQLHDRFEARCLNVFETFRVLSTMPRAFRGRQAVELAALTNGSRDTAITPVQLRRGLAEVFGVTLSPDELAIVLEFFFPDLPESQYDCDSDRSLRYAVRLPEFQQKIVAMSAVGHLQA